MPDDVDDPGDVAGTGGDPSAAGADDADAGVPGDGDPVAAAEEFDAEALAGLQEEDEAGAGEDEGQEGRTAARRSPRAADPIDDFIEQNYGGNRAAFVASLHEQRREGKAMADEIRELRQRIDGKPRDADAELKAALETDPEVQALNRDIQTIDKQLDAIEKRQVELATLADRDLAMLTQLEADLPHVEEGAAARKALSKIVSLRSAVTEYRSEFQTNETRLENKGNARAQYARELRKAVKDVRESINQREAQLKAASRNIDRMRETFSAAFTNLIKPFAVEPESNKGVYIKDLIRAQLADHLDSLGDEAEGLDAAGIYDSVERLLQAYAQHTGLQAKRPGQRPGVRPVGSGSGQSPRRVAVPSAPKPAAPRPGQPGSKVPGATMPRPGSAPRPRTQDDVLSDPDRVRARAEHIFNAGARAQARGMRGRLA